jgi:hypothetical protein
MSARLMVRLLRAPALPDHTSDAARSNVSHPLIQRKIAGGKGRRGGIPSFTRLKARQKQSAPSLAAGMCFPPTFVCAAAHAPDFNTPRGMPPPFAAASAGTHTHTHTWTVHHRVMCRHVPALPRADAPGARRRTASRRPAVSWRCRCASCAVACRAAPPSQATAKAAPAYPGKTACAGPAAAGPRGPAALPVELHGQGGTDAGRKPTAQERVRACATVGMPELMQRACVLRRRPVRWDRLRLPPASPGADARCCCACASRQRCTRRRAKCRGMAAGVCVCVCVCVCQRTKTAQQEQQDQQVTEQRRWQPDNQAKCGAAPVEAAWRWPRLWLLTGSRACVHVWQAVAPQRGRGSSSLTAEGTCTYCGGAV